LSKVDDGRWKRDKFLLQLLQIMPKYNAKDAVAFFDHWIASGHPGNIAGNPGFMMSRWHSPFCKSLF